MRCHPKPQQMWDVKSQKANTVADSLPVFHPTCMTAFGLERRPTPKKPAWIFIHLKIFQVSNPPKSGSLSKMDLHQVLRKRNSSHSQSQRQQLLSFGWRKKDNIIQPNTTGIHPGPLPTALTIRVLPWKPGACSARPLRPGFDWAPSPSGSRTLRPL